MIFKNQIGEDSRCWLLILPDLSWYLKAWEISTDVNTRKRQMNFVHALYLTQGPSGESSDLEARVYIIPLQGGILLVWK